MPVFVAGMPVPRTGRGSQQHGDCHWRTLGCAVLLLPWTSACGRPWTVTACCGQRGPETPWQARGWRCRGQWQPCGTVLPALVLIGAKGPY